MTSFVDHMKNITVPSMVQDINEMNHYWAMLTRIPGSGVSAQPNMDVVTTSHEEKLFPLDNGWYLRRETPVKNLIWQVISTTQQALSENDLGSRGVFKGRGWRVGLAIHFQP